MVIAKQTSQSLIILLKIIFSQAGIMVIVGLSTAAVSRNVLTSLQISFFIESELKIAVGMGLVAYLAVLMGIAKQTNQSLMILLKIILSQVGIMVIVGLFTAAVSWNALTSLHISFSIETELKIAVGMDLVA